MKVTILGCGWLGCLLGEHLIREGHSVFGSFRSESGKDKIEKSKIVPFHLDLGLNSQISTEIKEGTEVLVIAMPPVRKDDPSFYGAELVKTVLEFSHKISVIFTSSIGVYPKREGEFNESYLFENSEVESSVIQAEIQLKNALQNRLSILRLGGLIGPYRHPIKTLQGRTISNDGSSPINLIHSSDILKCISLLIEKSTYGKCYNLVFPIKKSKKIYYNLIAERHGLKRVEFGSGKSLNRSVNGSLVCEEMPFEYMNNPLDFSDKIL